MTYAVSMDHHVTAVGHRLHSLKFIAALQHAAGGAPAQTHPLLIKVDTKAGHGAGKPTSKQIDEAAHVYAFIGTQTGARWRD